MGMNFDQLLSELRTQFPGGSTPEYDSNQVGFTLVSNQDDGLVAYAVGGVLYLPGQGSPLNIGHSTPEQLKNQADKPLALYFNLDIETIGLDTVQPFSTKQATLAASFNASAGGMIQTDPVVRIHLTSSLGTSFAVDLAPSGNLLIGTGQPLKGSSDSAMYVVSLQFHE